MASTHNRSVAVATESTFGNVGSDGLVDATSGLTFYGLECDRASVTLDGQEAALVERSDTRASPHMQPPHPDTMYSSGWVRRRTGTVTLTCPLRTIGAASTYATYAAMPLGMILNSSMGRLGAAGSYDPYGDNTDVVAAGTHGVTSWTASDGSFFEVGGPVFHDKNGRLETSFITSISTDDLTSSPAFSTAPLATETLRPGEAFFPLLGVNGGGSLMGASVALRLDTDGTRTYCTGGRLQSVSIEASAESSVVNVVCTVRFAHIYDDHSNAAPAEPGRADGLVCNFRGSYAVISSATASDKSTAQELGRTALDCESWSVSVEFTLTPRGRPNDLLGMSNLAVSNFSITGSCVLSVPSTSYDDLSFDQDERSLLFGMGPTGTGNGAAVYIPAAVVTNDPSVRVLDGDEVHQRLEFSAGYWGGEPSGATTVANSIFRLALGT